ncbi:unnamed protein product [Brassica rapa subsp. trilocularis]
MQCSGIHRSLGVRLDRKKERSAVSLKKTFQTKSYCWNKSTLLSFLQLPNHSLSLQSKECLERVRDAQRDRGLSYWVCLACLSLRRLLAKLLIKKLPLEQEN